MKQVLVIRDKEHRAEVFGKLQNSIIFKLLETKEIDLLDPYKLGPDIADEVMGWIDGLSGNLLVSFKGHIYKSDLKKCQDGGETDIILFYTPPITDPENRQSVTVLILDEGSEEKNEKDI